MNLAALAKHLEIDSEELNEILSLFLVTTTSDLGKLQSALEHRDLHTAAALAHSIKGSAANLDLKGIYEVATHMEQAIRENHLETLPDSVRAIRGQLDGVSESLRQHAPSRMVRRDAHGDSKES